MITEYTFEQDQLDRKPISEDIENYLGRIQEKNPGHAVSFAINAKWGEGKTYFVSMWKNQIEKQMKDVAVYYNAWENDDCDSAILPLLYNIISIEEDEESEDFIEHAKFFFKTLGMNTFKFGINKVLGDYKEVAEFFSQSWDETCNEDIKTFFTEYDEYYGKRRKLQESLKELIPDDGNLWIFIDDLDRCKPRFAIDTLECIKHFFNIEHIIFIFAIDYSHLVIASEQVYGGKIDSTSYIKKFFDVIYQLPSPDRLKYIEYKIQCIQNENLLTFVNKKILEFYFNKFDFSLRDIDLTMTHIELFLMKNFEELSHCENLEIALKIYYYFMVIKDKYNSEYIDIIHGRFLLDTSHNENWKTLNKKFLVSNEIKELLEAISNGHAERHTTDIIKKYSLMETPLINRFSDHMEYFLR